MASKAKLSRKVLSLFLSFILLFTQTGFAQVAAVELNLGSHFSNLGSGFGKNNLRLPHLRYLSYNRLSNNIQILLDKGDLKDLKGPKLEESGKNLLKYFLIGVTLPDDSFWVNLRPDSENEIIPEALARTDIGKIFLAADVQLKKDTARLTSPDTRIGQIYWERLYKKAEQIYGTSNVSIPTLTRPWIVPDEIIIRESEGESAYIYKATLKVMLEQDHLKSSITYNFEDNRAKELNEYSSQLIRELILPELTKTVNNSKSYAGLRQVYYSLILSRWFKSRFYGKGGLYASYINKSDLHGLTSEEAWSKDTYFKQYQDSFKNGEYNLKTPINSTGGPSVRSYFSGGLEFGINMNITTQDRNTSPMISGFTGSSPVFLAAATRNGLVPFFGTATINNPISLSQGISSSPIISQSLGMFTSRSNSNNSLKISPIPQEMAKGKAQIAVYQYFPDSKKKWLLFVAKVKNETLEESTSLWLSGENVNRTNSNQWEYRKKGFHANIMISHNSKDNSLNLKAVPNGEVSEKLDQSTVDDFQVFLEPTSSSPISVQPVTSLRVYADINQRIWLDGLTFEMLLSGEFENLVRTHGITGVTTNPSLIKAYLSDSRVIDKAKSLAAKGLSKEEIYLQLVSELATTVLGIFQKAGVENAKFSVELDPNVNNSDVKSALKEALQWTDIDPVHMMVKVALTSDAEGNDTETGYKIIEEVISRGRNVNVTLIFTSEQYKKVVDAYIRGLQRGLTNVKEGKLSKEQYSRIYSVASFFVSRWDVYLEQNKLLSENTHGKAANSIAIKAYNEIFKNSFSDNNPAWKQLNTDAGALGLKVNPQDFLLASTGSKGVDMLKKNIINESIAATYPDGIYVYPIQGSFVVNTLPYGTIKSMIANGVAKNSDGTVAKTIESGYNSSKEVMASLAAANADLAKIGAALLKNATLAFLKDFGDVQNTLDNLVSGNASSPVILAEEENSYMYKGEPVVSGELPQEVLDLYNDPLIRTILSKEAPLAGIITVTLDPAGAKYVKYGTSGDRDVLYDPDPAVTSRFNVQRVLRDAQGVASYYKANKLKGAVRIGYETRLLAREYAYLTAAVLAANGIKAKLPANAVPLPSLAYSVANSQETDDPDAGGIMITASHNPWEWIGFKWLRPNGGAAPATITGPLEEITKENTIALLLTVSRGIDKKLIEIVDYKQDYINYILDNIPVEAKVALKKWGENKNNIVISNPVQGGAIGYVPQILNELGVKYEERNSNIDRMFTGSDKRGPNPDYAPDFDGTIAQAYKKGQNIIEIMQDVDADRFGVRDINGIRYTANELIPMYKWFLRTKGYKGAIGKTIPTSDFSNAVDRYWGDTTLEVDTGFKNLVDPLESGEDIVVGEESAHVGIGIWKKSKDDGIAVGLLAVWIVAETGKSLTEYKKEIESSIGAHFKYRRIDTPYKGVRRQEGAQMLELINLAEAASVVKRNNGKFNFEYKGNEKEFAGLPIINEKIIPVANQYGGLSKVLICYDPLSGKSSGYKMVFADNSVVTVRVSGTGEPVIRTYVEIVTPCTKETWDEVDAGSDSRWQDLANKARDAIGIYRIEDISSSPVGSDEEAPEVSLTPIHITTKNGTQIEYTETDSNAEVLVNENGSWARMPLSEAIPAVLEGLSTDIATKVTKRGQIRMGASVLPDQDVVDIFYTLTRKENSYFLDGVIWVWGGGDASPDIIGNVQATFTPAATSSPVSKNNKTTPTALQNLRSPGMSSSPLTEEIKTISEFYIPFWGKQAVQLYLRGEMALAYAAAIVHIKWRDGNWDIYEALAEIASSRIALDNSILNIKDFENLKAALRSLWLSQDETSARENLNKIPGINAEAVLKQADDLSKTEAHALNREDNYALQMLILTVGRPERLIATVEEINRQVSSSSPITKENSKRGGIDFRALPMSIQPLGSFKNLVFSLPSNTLLSQIDIENEITEISKMVNAGITPSGERVKELVGACYQKDELAEHRVELVSCLMGICKLEENNVEPTDTKIKEAIVMVDNIR